MVADSDLEMIVLRIADYFAKLWIPGSWKENSSEVLVSCLVSLCHLG